MRPTLIEVLTDVAFRAGIVGSYSQTIPTDKKLELIALVQQVREEAAVEAELPNLIMDAPFYLQIAGVYDVGTVAIIKGSVNCVGTNTVITAAMVGSKIRIGADPTVYVIQTQTSNVLFTINRPFMGASETVGGIEVIKDIYDLPPNVLTILNLKDLTNMVSVTERPAQFIHRAYPNPYDFTGNVVVYGKQGSRQFQEAVTVSAATTTTVTGTGLAGTFDDYYVGWNLYNLTRSQVRRVTGFVLSTGVITIDQEIVGQVSGDTIILVCSVGRVVVRSGPDSDIYLEGVGMRAPTKLINDSDIEYEIDEEYADRLLKVGTLLKYCIGGKVPPQISVADLRIEYQGIIAALSASAQREENREYSWGQNRTVKELNPIMGAGWPAYPENAM